MTYQFDVLNHTHPNLVTAYDMGIVIPKNLLKDDTHFENHGKIFGNPTLDTPLFRVKRTHCMRFDGKNDFIKFQNPLIDLKEFSIAFWVNPESWNGVVFSVSKKENTYISFNGLGNLVFAVSGKGPMTRQSHPIKTTYFVCCTKSSSCEGKIYVNGKFLMNGQTGIDTHEKTAYLARYETQQMDFKGRLDTVLFYNRLLEPEQVQGLYRRANPR